MLVSSHRDAKDRITSAGSLASWDRSTITHISTTPLGSEEALSTCLGPSLRAPRGLLAIGSAPINSY